MAYANTGEHSRDYYRDLRDLEFVGATWDAPCESVVAVDANFALACVVRRGIHRRFSGSLLGRLVREPWFFVHESEKGHAAHDDDGDADRRAGSRAREDARVRLPRAQPNPGSTSARRWSRRPVFPLASATSTDEGGWRVEGGAWRVEYHDGVRGSSLDHAEQEVMAEASSRVFSTERAAADFFFEKENEKEDEKDEKDGGAREPVGSGSVEPRGSGPGASITGEGTHVFWHPDAHFMFREVASAARRVVAEPGGERALRREGFGRERSGGENLKPERARVDRDDDPASRSTCLVCRSRRTSRPARLRPSPPRRSRRPTSPTGFGSNTPPRRRMDFESPPRRPSTFASGRRGKTRRRRDRRRRMTPTETPTETPTATIPIGVRRIARRIASFGESRRRRRTLARRFPGDWISAIFNRRCRWASTRYAPWAGGTPSTRSIATFGRARLRDGVYVWRASGRWVAGCTTVPSRLVQCSAVRQPVGARARGVARRGRRGGCRAGDGEENETRAF